jgi:hypothetical protein
MLTVIVFILHLYIHTYTHHSYIYCILLQCSYTHTHHNPLCTSTTAQKASRGYAVRWTSRSTIGQTYTSPTASAQSLWFCLFVCRLATRARIALLELQGICCYCCYSLRSGCCCYCCCHQARCMVGTPPPPIKHALRQGGFH